jgi:hypothetical protein
MSDKITLLSHRYALEQRIRTLKNPTLNEGKDTSKLLAKMTAMLEHVNQQIAEMGLPQDQINSPWPMDNPLLPQRIPVSEYDSHPDHEVQMARSELYRAAKCAISLEKMLKQINEQQGLEGWVQAKITKAADYLESVYHYMDYEMRSPQEENIGEAVETIRPYGSYKPGQQAGESVDADSPSPSATPINKPAGPGQAASANPNQPPEPAEPGQMSATPPAGGATPVPTAPGHVKVIRVGPDGQPTNDAPPLTIPQTDLENKQKMGYRVAEDASGGASSAGSMGGGFGNGFANGGPGSIMRRKPRKKKAVGEAEEKKKVVHCSQCGKGFNATGLKPPHHTGFSHCKDHKGMKVIAEAKTMKATEKEHDGPEFTGYWKGTDKGRPGKKMVGSGC